MKVRPRLLEGCRIAACVFASVLIASCGGGVDSGGTGAPSAVGLSAGPVDGLGSIIVNGIRYEVDAATIVDQDDQPLTVDQLQVGMATRIDATAVDSSGSQPTATAITIRASSELIGPVGSIDAQGTSMVVLGQSVRITTATWFDSALSGGIAAVSVGQTLEVYGQYNARTNEYVATRIVPRAAATAFEIRGLLAASNPAAHLLVVGGLAISDASIPAGSLPALTVGKFVRVSLGTAPTGNLWTALTIAPGNAALPDRPDARLAGRISNWVSSTQFTLNGVSIDASSATFPAGSAGVVLGARVAVAGSTSGGVLTASTVTVKGDETAANSIFELHGLITALNPTTQTLVVRGVKVNYSAQVQFTGGGLADLAVGRAIVVTGALAANKTGINAQTIGFQ